MGSEWKELSLGQLFNFSSGLSKPRSEFGHGYEFLSFKDVFNNYFVPDKLTSLVNSTAMEQESYSILKGDVFLTRTSETMDELGMSCVALKDYKHATFNGFTKRLRPMSLTEIFPEYAGYYFRSPRFRRDVLSMSSLSTRASLNNEMLGRLTMVLPSYTTQVAIGTILKSLDDKIENNRRTNETLEAMARAIFKSWFVDFDPVRAKSEGRPPSGMDSATAALFPNSFQDSPLGPIPQGWKVEPFSNVIKLIGGGTPKTAIPEYWDGNIPWFSVVDSPHQGDVFVVDTEKHISNAGLNNSSTRLLPIGTTIISARGTVGNLALVGNEMAMNQSCYGIRCIYDECDYFTYLMTSHMVEILKQNTHGSVFDTITRDTFKSIDVVMPDKKIAQRFDTTVNSIMKRILSGLYESRTLAEIRDALLPKLLSGEIRVKDAEKFVEGKI